MQLNLFTSNDKFRSEIYIVIKLLENGLQSLQIKKPDFTKKQLRSYIDQIPEKFHNKLIIQINDKFFVFSLKNIDDSHRLLSTLENYFRNNGRNDAIFVRDTSTTQRKWMYNLLVKNGFDKKKLYRQTTTFSKRT